ncbi:head-tail connector protein [Priestia flexa]|uniref:head-tail connector protein n=1 Tax=Priestia flexa TaxID=86664 RepID=UPI002492D5E0|nr:head-tail connector protein [Priestia flexa]
MKLDELKVRLKIPAEDTKQDAYLTVALEDAIEDVQKHCNDSFIDSETDELKLPGGVKQAITKLVKAYQENSNVQSQSLGDMRKSFFEGGTMNEVTRLLKPYVKKKVRFL